MVIDKLREIFHRLLGRAVVKIKLMRLPDEVSDVASKYICARCYSYYDKCRPADPRLNSCPHCGRKWNWLGSTPYWGTHEFFRELRNENGGQSMKDLNTGGDWLDGLDKVWRDEDGTLHTNDGSLLGKKWVDFLTYEEVGPR